MTNGPDRSTEIAPLVNLVAAVLPGVYLLCGSLAVTILTAVVLTVVIALHRT
jgi:hypothetical protein